MAEYIFPSLPGQLNVGDTIRFNYTGGSQTFTVPAGIDKLKVECWGAGTGPGSDVNGKFGGGYSTGILTIDSKITNRQLVVYVGGQNSGATGGWNGGANGGSTVLSWSGVTTYGAGGCGATDIRVGGTALSNRIMVSGGMGGWGGAGGGLVGGKAANAQPGATGGEGGTQTAGGFYQGTLGNGGMSYFTSTNGCESASGGGGYYGGGGGYNPGVWNGGSGGGGGSSYISGYPGCVPETHSSGITFLQPEMVQGGNNGHGYVIMTVLPGGFDYASVKIDGSVKKGDKCWVKVDGVWKEVDKTFVKADSSWKPTV